MRRLLFALPLGLLAACGGDNNRLADNKDVLMKCDFDTLYGWLPDHNALTREQAHSGSYSLKVDKDREYAVGYAAQLGQLSETRFRGVRFEGWVYLTAEASTANINFVTKDGFDGKDLGSASFDYGTVSEHGKWVKVSKEITFPAGTNSGSVFLLYLWRANASAPAYLDDVQLTALR